MQAAHPAPSPLAGRGCSLRVRGGLGRGSSDYSLSRPERLAVFAPRAMAIMPVRTSSRIP